MDYAPVKLGFWNCRDVRLSQRDAVLAAGDFVVDYGDLFDEGNRIITERGSQIHGAASRCFEASLISMGQLATNYVPTLPKYGLCFAANCPSESYLQFAIRTWTGVYWYGCHEAGTKIYIPGFLGSVTCPNSTAFCSHPVNSVLLTGKMFPETNPVLDIIFWGLVYGISLVVVIVLYASKKLNRFVTGWWVGKLVGE